MCKKVPSILPGEKICHTCRKQVSDMSEHAEPDLSNSRSFIDEQSSPYDHDYPKIELSHESTMTDSFSESESSPVEQYHSTLATESREWSTNT